jgi:hypothetical protein
MYICTRVEERYGMAWLFVAYFYKYKRWRSTIKFRKSRAGELILLFVRFADPSFFADINPFKS